MKSLDLAWIIAGAIVLAVLWTWVAVSICNYCVKRSLRTLDRIKEQEKRKALGRIL